MNLIKGVRKETAALCTVLLFAVAPMAMPFPAFAQEIDISSWSEATEISNHINAALSTGTDAELVVKGDTMVGTSNPSNMVSINFNGHNKKIVWKAKLSGGKVDEPLLFIKDSDGGAANVFEFDGGNLSSAKDAPLLVFQNVEFIMKSGNITNTNANGDPVLQVVPRSAAPKTKLTITGGTLASFSSDRSRLCPVLHIEDLALADMRGGLIYSNASQIIGDGTGDKSAVVSVNNPDISALGGTRVLVHTPVTGINKYADGSNTNLKMYPESADVHWEESPGFAKVSYDGGWYLMNDPYLEVYKITGTVSDVDYDGQPHGMTNVAPADADITLKYIGVDGTTYNSTEAPREVGKYKVSATVAQSGVYAAADVDEVARFEIRATGSQGNNQNPGNTNPGNATPGNATPGNANPGNSNPGNTNPGNTNPGNTTPGNTNPGNTNPGNTNPGNTNPGNTNPGNTNPGGKQNNKNNKPNSNDKKSGGSRKSKKSGKSGGSSGGSRKSNAAAGKKLNTSGGQWLKDSIGWWYKNADGSYPRSTWKQLSWKNKTDWYCFDERGYSITGWKKLTWNGRSDWYLFNPSGQMLTGWQEVDGKWYYLYEKTEAGHLAGNLAADTTIGTYRVDKDGVWIK